MRKLLFLFSLALAAGCSQAPFQPMNPADFAAEVDGKAVALYTLQNGNVTLQLTNYGARVVSVFTRDREGRYANIVVGQTTYRIM